MTHRGQHKLDKAANKAHTHQGCSPKKEVGGRLKQDLDKDLQLHRILILLY